MRSAGFIPGPGEGVSKGPQVEVAFKGCSSRRGVQSANRNPASLDRYASVHPRFPDLKSSHLSRYSCMLLGIGTRASAR